MARTKIRRKRSKYPKLATLKGLLRQNDITIADLAKKIGRAQSTVSLALNGHSTFDALDIKNIMDLLENKSGTSLSAEEIFAEIFRD